MCDQVILERRSVEHKPAADVRAQHLNLAVGREALVAEHVSTGLEGLDSQPLESRRLKRKLAADSCSEQVHIARSKKALSAAPIVCKASVAKQISADLYSQGHQAVEPGSTERQLTINLRAEQTYITYDGKAFVANHVPPHSETDCCEASVDDRASQFELAGDLRAVKADVAPDGETYIARHVVADLQILSFQVLVERRFLHP